MKHMKKLLVLALVVMSVMAIAVPAMASTNKWVIAVPNVNFRVSPGGALIERIDYGEYVTEYSTSYVSGVQWSYVYYDGTYGYIMTQYLSTTNPGLLYPWLDRYGLSTLGPSDTYNWYVEVMQEDLMDLGYDLPEYGADGFFGDETTEAVEEFQADYQLTVDGYVGNQTKEALYNAYFNLD